MKRHLLCALVATVAGISACGGTGSSSSGEAVGDESAAIINGTTVATDTLGTALFNYSGSAGSWGCSATVINGNWLLTAHHCVTVGNATTGGTSVAPSGITASILNGGSAVGVNIFPHPTLDVALVELAGDLVNPKTGTPFTANLYTGQVTSIVGQTVFCEGWGDNTFAQTGFGTLRSANLEISQMDGTQFRIVPNGSGQIEWHGDSGSSCFSGTQILGVQSTCEYNSNSVLYCDQVAVENFYDWATAIMSATSFAEDDSDEMVVLGQNGIACIEYGPFGTLPPDCTEVDSTVQSFQLISGLSPFEGMLVLGTDGNLWREAPNGKVPPPRTQVDSDVRSYQGLSLESVFVLGTNGNLWLESPNGSVPPPRTQVDGNVRAFQAIDSNHVVVLGENTNLWLETGPFGNVPPSRIEIDSNVRSFQALDTGHIVVLGANGNLWLEEPNGSVPAPRTQVDGNVIAFQALSTSSMFVLGSNGNLWLESPNGSVPPPRSQVDGNVASFKAYDATDVLVDGLNGNLWFEHAPFGTVPPARQAVDDGVRP